MRSTNQSYFGDKDENATSKRFVMVKHRNNIDFNTKLKCNTYDKNSSYPRILHAFYDPVVVRHEDLALGGLSLR